MKPGSLSLLVPVFNHARYLPDLLRSMEQQTRQPDEILFSDDGSSDGSPGLVEAWIQRRPGAQLFRHEKNLGITGNSNFLLRQARGEYVLTLHSDDGLREAGALAEMAQTLDRNQRAAMVTCPRVRVNETNQFLGLEKKLEAGSYDRKAILRVVLTTEANPLGEPSAIMFRRSALPHGFDPAYRQLWDLKAWLEILHVGEVVVLPAPWVEIRSHAMQATRANEKAGRGLEEHLRLFAELLLEADTVLGRRSKSVLLYKLGGTVRRFPNHAGGGIKARLREAKKKLGAWRYWLDLFWYRLNKITLFIRRPPGMTDSP